MAEEHGCRAPEGHRLCANNCGFFGSPATQNYCSKCYRDINMKMEQENSAKSAVENSLFPAPVAEPSSNASVSAPEKSEDVRVGGVAAEADTSAAVRPNKCMACRKRVGLMGFTCRCGITFCGTHRYPEQHGCTFDFKAAGRDAIAKENPVIKAEKLAKI